MKDRTVHGDNIRALRVPTGVPMREFADAVGCGWRHLQMIETYKRQPGAELLYRILKELGRLHGRVVTLDEVTTPGAPPKQELELAQAAA